MSVLSRPLIEFSSDNPLTSVFISYFLHYPESFFPFLRASFSSIMIMIIIITTALSTLRSSYRRPLAGRVYIRDVAVSFFEYRLNGVAAN